jgi:hypothetical protein
MIAGKGAADKPTFGLRLRPDNAVRPFGVLAAFVSHRFLVASVRCDGTLWFFLRFLDKSPVETKLLSIMRASTYLRSIIFVAVSSCRLVKRSEEWLQLCQGRSGERHVVICESG